MYPKRSFRLSTAVVFTMGRSRTPGRATAGEFFDSAEDYGVPVPRVDGSGSAANIQGLASAIGSIMIDQCRSRIFVLACLLTGSAKQAEAAMPDSIRQLGIDAASGGCLSWKAIAAAIVRGDPGSGQSSGEALPALPLELLRVLRLPPRLRQCFVLRVLMAMPRQYCAGLLRIDAEEVDANSLLAAQELANFAAVEAAN